MITFIFIHSLAVYFLMLKLGFGSFSICHRRFLQSRTFCTGKSWQLKFPDMADTKEAMVEKWLKKEGESVSTSDDICEVSLFPSDLMVGVNSPRAGILAKILVPVGKKLPVNEPIALVVEDRDEYMEYIDATRCAEHDEEGIAAARKVVEEKKKKPDTKVLLREIKHLIQEGHIKEDSGEYIHIISR